MSRMKRVAIAGCGAVTDAYYGPALQARVRAGSVEVVGVHDPAAARMATVAARCFPNSARRAGFDQLLDDAPDLLIVASPPAAHAVQAIGALDRGIAVLCEKPLASTLADAEAMQEAAARSGRVLAVGMVRRQFPASRVIRRMIGEGALGDFLGADGFEGGPFRWPVSSPAYFSKQLSGGGVLADIGAHVLDLLHAWLGPLDLVRAEDDAMGGVEANVKLGLTAQGAPISLRLSRDWARPNTLSLRFAKGALVWEGAAPERALMRLPDGGVVGLTEPGAPSEFLGCFGAQLDAALVAAEGGAAEIATAAEVIPTVRLIERAYAQRRAMSMPWLEAPDVA